MLGAAPADSRATEGTTTMRPTLSYALTTEDNLYASVANAVMLALDGNIPDELAVDMHALGTCREHGLRAQSGAIARFIRATYDADRGVHMTPTDSVDALIAHLAQERPAIIAVWTPEGARFVTAVGIEPGTRSDLNVLIADPIWHDRLFLLDDDGVIWLDNEHMVLPHLRYNASVTETRLSAGTRDAYALVTGDNAGGDDTAPIYLVETMR